MFKNYIFDLYGTLVDINTNEDSQLLWEKLALFYSYKGANYSSKELYYQYSRLIRSNLKLNTNTNFPDFNIEEIFKELFNKKAIFPSDDTIRDTAQIFRVLSINKLSLYNGVIEFLEDLKSKNKNIYLLSNAQRVFTLYEMKLLDIDKYFDEILFSSDYCVCKPDKLFYNSLIEKYNLNPIESIMIGNDYICDIQGAKEVKLNTLYIHSNLSPDLVDDVNSNYSILDGDFNKVKPLILK
ncbi:MULTISPECIES: HAD family hydrolase [Clostridium]|uniref:HAD family hydrolase n=1 Tax=Clostridium TaxID=1485 RepID=UPI00189BB396|nr:MULTISPECIES: HAD family hydrolase [Clostridium]MCR1952638.1 HAD family hydrolase [Clostridium sp. DSM 100503]MDI9215448.1 HAD family hydrolase [Clostridium tertium]